MEVSNLLIGLIYAFFALPAIPLGWAWVTVIRTRRTRASVLPWSSILILTVSYVWCLLLITPYGSTLAPDYGPRRAPTIDGNIGAALLGTGVAAFSRGMRLRLIPAGVLLFLLWGYLGLVSAAI